jgi:SAM-dependent methyltransferase
MHWRVKGLVQKVLGVVPGGLTAHYWMQRYFGGLRGFQREFSLKIDDWMLMVDHLRAAGVEIPGSRLFEIGTGWYPTFPFMSYLAGARRVITVDLNTHLKPDLVRRCAESLAEYVPMIAAASGTALVEVERRQRQLVERLAGRIDLAQATDGVVAYEAPMDATRVDIGPNELDVVFSNSVLEHVPPLVIDELYAEGMRILRPGGVMFHSVNCGDHYAYVDRNINQLNYLGYSDSEWQHWNNAFLYQNRMRAHEFVERAAAAGFEIVLDTGQARDERLQELAAMKVHAQFAGIPAAKLCVTTIDFIGRKPL